MDSLWRKTFQMPEFEALTSDIQTDVLIIGGGITSDTTAKITSQHGLIYDRLIRTFGIEKARLYLDANQQALRRYKDLCQEIDCDFIQQDAFVYSLQDRRALDVELDALHRLGFEASFSESLPLAFPIVGAVRFPEQAQFHPLKFAAHIARGLNIYEHTKVLELKPGQVITNHGRITAEKIIVATHFPLLNKHGGYFMKLYQDRSYVLALKNAPVMEGMYRDADQKGLSFRSWQNLLLLGGGSHRTGKKGGGWSELEAFARRHYPAARIEARWATQDCMSLDGVPYIGQYSKTTPNLYVATGFNKWGMTSAMAAAMILADLIQGKDNPYAEVFTPSRSSLRPQLFLNAAEATHSLLTPTVPRCPHMGCALKYNRTERSWDCPCHGSRFQEDGRLINNPATDDKWM